MTKADCVVASRRLHLSQKVALEHTAKTTGNGQLANTFCTFVRGNDCLYQQVATVYIHHSNGESEISTAEIHSLVTLLATQLTTEAAAQYI